ncbi:MAG: hypothetical protein ACR2MX_14760 [Cyclobacteriaceae bacterium]
MDQNESVVTENLTVYVHKIDWRKRLVLFWLALALLSCGGSDDPDPAVDNGPAFSDRISKGAIQNDFLVEASGLAVSRNDNSHLWSHNDKDDQPFLFLLNNDGSDIGRFYLKGAVNRDWEDLAIGPGPDANETYLYIGDIGNNDLVYDFIRIYRLVEPDILEDTLKNIETIRLNYPDGIRDAETLLLDPLTKDIYVITKRDTNSRIYRAAYPQTDEQVMTFEGALPYNTIVSGDISIDGLEVLLKSYFRVFYWRRDIGTSLVDLFQQPADTLPYSLEPQGEAMAWHPDGSGYYTLSEEKETGVEAVLYFYERNDP